ncbi:hypothetical protein [Brunnivagina elsteri]|uniref:hypothetical protein n=1 Tax=Brunnivagina elsteri TaxID=1247191 RepID=UPI001B80BE31|nr:hypothetical protein [Calothrix elsteri]
MQLYGELEFRNVGRDSGYLLWECKDFTFLYLRSRFYLLLKVGFCVANYYDGNQFKT